MAEDVKLDPYKTSKEILMKLKLEEIENDVSDLMSINDFKFLDYRLYYLIQKVFIKLFNRKKKMT